MTGIGPSSTKLDGLHVVVVNWNGGSEENLRCLTSVLEQGLPEERLVFVDNGSADGSLAAVTEQFPGLSLIENGANRGFGEAANQGARKALDAGARAVAFVNNDLRFNPAQGCLPAMMGALESNPRLGMVGPRVLFDDGTERVWCAGGRLDYRANLSTLLGNGEPDGPDWRVTRDVDYVAGCAAVCRAETLREVGLFEASYFAYMEDVELGQRMRRAGWAVQIHGEHAAYHAPSSATGGGYGARRKWMQALNSVRFLKQHGGALHWVRFAVFDVATLPIVWLLRAPRGDSKAVLAKAKGIWDGIRGRRVTADALEPGASRLW